MSTNKRSHDDLTADMTVTANCSFKAYKEDEFTSETSNVVIVGKKVSRVAMTLGVNSNKDDESAGEMDGDLYIERLMYYSHFDKANPYQSESLSTGLVKFTGKLNGKSGEFLMQEIGNFVACKSTSQLTILPNSGTNELTGITGYGERVFSETETFIKLTFSFPSSSL
jgi:hypothetical protein